jgi:hypothetical protein
VFGRELPVRRLADGRLAASRPGSGEVDVIAVGPAGEGGRPVFVQQFLWAFERVPRASR